MSGFYGSLGCRLDTGVTSAVPGSAHDMCLIVSGVGAARDELVAGGVGASEVFREGAPGVRFHQDGTSGRVSGPAPDDASYGWFVSFSGLDGNSWLFQGVTTRLPGRVDHPATSFASVSDLAGTMRRVGRPRPAREAHRCLTAACSCSR